MIKDGFYLLQVDGTACAAKIEYGQIADTIDGDETYTEEDYDVKVLKFIAPLHEAEDYEEVKIVVKADIVCLVNDIMIEAGFSTKSKELLKFGGFNEI